MNDLRDKAEKALDRVRLFDDSIEVAFGVNEIDDYWAQEACVHIEGLWQLTKQMQVLLSRAIKHINELEAELANAQRKPLTDEEMRECAQAMNAEPLAEGWPELIKFARAIERAHGIGGGE